MISINEDVDVWITCQMDWFMEAAVTQWGSLFWTCPTSPIRDWLTDWLAGWLNDFLTDNQLQGNPDTYMYLNRFIFFMFLIFFFFWSDLKVKKKSSAFFLPFLFVPFCACSLSFCISLAGRCYQCSYCQGSKSRGAHESPWQWAHAFPSVGFLRCVLCVGLW